MWNKLTNVFKKKQDAVSTTSVIGSANKQRQTNEQENKTTGVPREGEAVARIENAKNQKISLGDGNEHFVVEWGNEFEGTNSIGSEGLMSHFNKNGELSGTWQIRSGGHSERADLLGKNNRCPKGAWRVKQFKETTPVPGASPEETEQFVRDNGLDLGYPKTDDGRAFFRGETSFKFDIPTPGTGRSAVLMHPTPFCTSGCIGIYTDQNLTNLRDQTIEGTANNRSILIHVP